MNERFFTKKQIEYLYSNAEFFGFINQYFGKYNNVSFSNGLSYSEVWDDDLKTSDRELLLRLTLANVSRLRSIIVRIERNLSYSFKNINTDIKGEIKGRLRINEYFKRKGMQQIPKNFPCTIKQKTYTTAENVFLIFVINRVVRRIKEYQSIIKALNASNSRESQLLDEHLKFFINITKKAYYTESVFAVKQIEQQFSNKFPKERDRELKLRLKKRQMPNVEAYSALSKWYEIFDKNDLSFSGEQIAETLIYDEQFSDKLFELWILYRLKQIFINDYRFKVIEQNSLQKRKDTFIYKVITHTNKELCLYFQKGKELFWDDIIKSKWNYVDPLKPLRGIPDIVVEYIDGDKKKVVLLDAKNRTRKKGENSEEIYKMFGYYENFSLYIQQKYGEEYRFYSALIFRNDQEPFCEYLMTTKDDQMMTLSLSPTDDDNLNQNQIRLLCRFILDACGKEGCVAEVIGEYQNYKEVIHNQMQAGTDEEDILNQISLKNHRAFENTFSLPEMEKEIERTKDILEKDHFPHIWNQLSDLSRKMLAMAEFMFNHLGNSANADYAPLCLEYCRALEVEFNHVIYDEFKEQYNITELASANRNYLNLTKVRDLTLGECVFVLSKALPPTPARWMVNDLKQFVDYKVKRHQELWNNINLLRDINESYRREAAHTSIIGYEELKKCREILLGIGHISPFYILLDNR